MARALAAAAFLFALGSPALAQTQTSYGLLDSARNTTHFPCITLALSGVPVCYPQQVLEGVNGSGTPTAVSTDSSGLDAV